MDNVLPWVAWEKIDSPKEKGGWGIKDHSLATKSGWSLLTKENLWTSVIKRKYIDPLDFMVWLRTPEKLSRNSSVILKETIESFDIVIVGLSWVVGKWYLC